jgi:excisionase family DNA binding protein
MTLEEMMLQVLNELDALRNENSKIQHKIDTIETQLKKGVEPTNAVKLLSIAEVATRLDIGFDSVRRLMDAEELKWVKVGTRKGYRIYESSVRDFAKRRGFSL